LALQVQQTGRPAGTFRVLKAGYVESNLSLILVERPFSQWTIARANHIMHHQLNDRELAAELAACPLLAPKLGRLFNRAIRGINLDSQPRLIGMSRTIAKNASDV